MVDLTNMLPKAEIIWSPQQQAFLDWCRNGSGSCILVAVAGAGKTTVLIAGGEVIEGQVAYMAYNRDVVDETKAKLDKRGISWKKMQANTAHGFGFGAYRKARPDVRLDDNKVRNLINKQMGLGNPLAVYAGEIKRLVSLAKQHMIGGPGGHVNDMHTWLELADHHDVFDPDEGETIPEQEIIQFAQEVLRQSTAMLDLIDFDDMIYMPLVHKVRFWRFANIFVDEAQDTNAARRALVRAMLMPGGRVVAVGDPAQAIYGFTGADADSLDLIARDFNCVRLPLTVSYRCPQEVVKFAQQWVNHIQAAPQAPVGSVKAIAYDELFSRNDLGGNAAILCRNNKPLVSLAFALIRRRIPCRIEGKDIAKRIQKLITRWKVKTLDALETKLDIYLQRETTKLLAKKQEAKLAEVEDAVETVRVIIDQCRQEKKTRIADAVAFVDTLFGDKVTNMLVLSSIHKAKGREWEQVFWLDRTGTCPSKWARQAWQQEQERNLMYVAATRAKADLIELQAAPTTKQLRSPIH
ncbi:MAG TPA: ATP-dependent helicase [Candidatus Paceibacterota bacterium]